jgi:hypothetical protein
MQPWGSWQRYNRREPIMKSEAEKEADRKFFLVNGKTPYEEAQASAWFGGLFVIALIIAAVAFVSWLVGFLVTAAIIAAAVVALGAVVWWLTGY